MIRLFLVLSVLISLSGCIDICSPTSMINAISVHDDVDNCRHEDDRRREEGEEL